MKPFSLLVFTCFLLTSCHWFKKKDDPTPLEQLPPATQEGKRAFGCLVNGQVWLPSGNNGTSNYKVYYDPTYRKGTLNITAYRYFSKTDNDVQYITLFSDSISIVGKYQLVILNHQEALFSDLKRNCTFLAGESHFRSGSLAITRLDLSAGIISGTFEFTLAKPGCDTIKVTNGRFDRKL